MSVKYIIGFSIFLIVLVACNIYFYYNLTSVNKHVILSAPRKVEATSSVHKDIIDHVYNLPNEYKVKNPNFTPLQRNLVQSFNASVINNLKSVWNYVDEWADDESLFPHKDGAPGQILQAMRASQIALVDNAPKGTQLKLLLLLEGKQKLLFKPKRYNLTHIINGHIYAGFDRHNSEVFAYYLAMVLNFKWVAPVITRRINIDQEIMRLATPGLKKTMVKNEGGRLCIYGKCYYCKINETVCPDSNGELEGAAILYLDKQFRIHKSPWRRSYNSKKMEWEKDNDFCKKVGMTLSTKRILNLVDTAIFDFLIQNGDRHRYEIYKEKIVLLDNGKGLGNPMVDVLDILAPLYQCCM
ncbi:hypothetical protein O3G_MSEX006601 [Manduca sexta]|uniref:FAM20 C-terminal domain-containing protein n=1 Tax=Manduca sexta TaxID=7130 RepID=A0A921Z473_MANSE|nr:hypothetical protein O3G_MSEX006601 [Manduca sexta]